MKNILFLCICIMIFSCNSANDGKLKESSDGKNSSKPVADDADNVISFKADGEIVNTKGLTISRSALSNAAPILNITSNMHIDKHTINVNLKGTVAGTYNLIKGNFKESYGVYFPDYDNSSDSYSFTNGSFNISEVDTIKNIVNGTFNGDAVNTEGKIIKITDGKIINGKLTPGIQDSSKIVN